MLPLKLHWDTMIDIQLFTKYLKFLDKNYNYAIEQSIENVKKAAVMWVINNKIKKRLLMKVSFVTAVYISQMNLLTSFKEINQQYIKNKKAFYKWICEEFKNHNWLNYNLKNLCLKSEINFNKHDSSFINMYYDDLMKDLFQLNVVKHFMCKKFKNEKILIFINKIAEVFLIIKVYFVSNVWISFLLITSLDINVHSL